MPSEPLCTACNEPQGTNARNGCPACVRWWKRVMMPLLVPRSTTKRDAPPVEIAEEDLPF
jgi:hypothetical protein